MRCALKNLKRNLFSFDLLLEKCLVLFCAFYTCRSIFLAFDKDEYMPLYAFLSLFVARLCVPLGILYLCRIRRCTKGNIWLLILPVSYWLMQIIHTNGGYSGGGELTFFSTAVFVLLPDRIKRDIFQTFYSIVQAANVVSLILWVIFIIGGTSFFQQELFYAQNGLESAHYYRFLIFAIYKYGHSFPRLCGIFNEPGALGTVCALLLICTFKRTRFLEKFLLIATGIMTFSFAFFLIVFLFLAVYLYSKDPRNLVILCIVAIIFLQLPKIDFHNEALNATAARFSITSDGFAGDNRTNSTFDLAYDQFLNSNDIWFGRGAGTLLGGSTASYKSSYIVPYGILGTAFLLGSWLWFALRRAQTNKQCLLYIFFFFLSLYQRPYGIICFWGYVLLFGGIEWIKEE